MGKKSDIDKALFKEAMKDVTPLKHTKISPSKPLTMSIKRRPQSPRQDNDIILFPFSDYETLPPVKSNELIEFFRTGLQHKVLRKIRAGQYNIEARLDLHGMLVEEAREALGRFIIQCRREGIRNVLIIHGKGRAHHDPILKNKLNHWLRQTNDVLAFCSTRSNHGGTGALYVLLKNAHHRGHRQ